MSETLPAVQILPMNRREDPGFKNYRDEIELQEKFFLHDLPERQGKYYYRESGVKMAKQKVVLFQSDAKIIASATLVGTEKFKQPKEDRGAPYKGALYFDVRSIKVFDPIPWDKVSRIWPEATKPCQAKFLLNPSGYAVFEEELKNVKKPSC